MFQKQDISKNFATLSWENISVYVKKKSKKGVPSTPACPIDPSLHLDDRTNFSTSPTGIGLKKIVNDVSGVVIPGTLLAILGGSGAGKSTLMNVLANRNLRDYVVSGEVKVNGSCLNDRIANISAYVQQVDLFFGNLTVRETLLFRAMLKMDKSSCKADRVQRVEEAIREMGLTRCADNKIGCGGTKMGISGGEAKRLSFACEILTNPLLVFCDEPTSGLDTFMAQNIVQTLKAMSQKGRTILCTIHQPSSEIFAMFDSMNYTCPNNFNPADFYIMSLAVIPGQEVKCQAQVQEICDKFSGTAQSAEIQESIADIRKDTILSKELSSQKSRYQTGWCGQFSVVLWRSWLSLMRDMFVMRVRLVQTLITALMLGLIYLQVDCDQTGVQNINGVLFLLITSATFTNLFSVINSFPNELPIFLREYNSRMYGVDVYFLAKTIAEFPTYIILPFIAITIDYWMIGLYNSWEKYLICAGIIILVSNVAVSFGLLVSSMAGSTNIALAVAPPIMVPLLMFGGFFLNDDSIPVYFVWLKYISWFKYSNELLVVNQWKDIQHIGCDSNSTSLNCHFRTGQDVLNYMNYSTDDNWLNWILLFALFAGYRIFAFLFLFIRALLSKK